MSIALQFTTVTKEFNLQQGKTIKDLVSDLIKGRSWSKKHLVFDSMSFVINKGETVGIVGKNGAGKSTLLKLIAGVTQPTKGTVTVNGRVAPVIELTAGFHHELSGLENIYLNAAILGLHKAEVEERLDAIIQFSELGEFIHVPVKKYSTGMFMRLGFSIAIQMDAPIILLDEVLAVGDAEFQEKCLVYLEGLKKSKEKTIIFVSHDEEAITRFCDRALLIHEHTVHMDGTPEKVFEEYHRL